MNFFLNLDTRRAVRFPRTPLCQAAEVDSSFCAEKLFAVNMDSAWRFYNNLFSFDPLFLGPSETR